MISIKLIILEILLILSISIHFKFRKITSLIDYLYDFIIIITLTTGTVNNLICILINYYTNDKIVTDTTTMFILMQVLIIISIPILLLIDKFSKTK